MLRMCCVTTLRAQQDSEPPVFLGNVLDRTWADSTELKVGVGIVQLNVAEIQQCLLDLHPMYRRIQKRL
jgi:hypothetical protein